MIDAAVRAKPGASYDFTPELFRRRATPSGAAAARARTPRVRGFRARPESGLRGALFPWQCTNSGPPYGFYTSCPFPWQG